MRQFALKGESAMRITFDPRLKEQVSTAYARRYQSLPRGTVVSDVVANDGDWRVDPRFVDYLRKSTNIPFQTPP